MHKEEFINLINESNREKYTKKQINEMIDIFVKGVETALSKGERVNLIGFGSFYVNDIGAREGRNPKTGQAIKIAAHKRPMFKAGQNLKNICNNK